MSQRRKAFLLWLAIMIPLTIGLSITSNTGDFSTAQPGANNSLVLP